MKDKNTSVLRFLSMHNPFYLLSAMLMLAGCFLIVNPWAQGGRKLGDLLLTWGVINGYEIAVIAMAIVLFRTGRAGRDVSHLVFVALLFLFDSVFLADAFSISGGGLDIVLVAISLGAAAAKLTALLVGLKIKIEVDSLIFSALSIVLIFAAPVIISQCIHAGADCEAPLFYLWVAFTCIAFSYFLWRYFAGRKWKPCRDDSFWRLLVMMSCIMGTIHLIAVGLELSGGFKFDYIAPLVCILPLAIRCLAPSVLGDKEKRTVLDVIPGILVIIAILMPSKGGEHLLNNILSYRMAVTMAFAVTGFISLKEKHPGSLVWGAIIIFLSILNSRVVSSWGNDDLLVLLSGGLALTYLSSVLLVRRRDRLSLSLFVAGSNLLLTALFARFEIASFFVYVQSTGTALLVLEFLLWRDSKPIFRNVIAGVLLFVTCAYLIGEGGIFLHAYAGAQAASLFALALWQHLGWLIHISAAGSAVVAIKTCAFLWPQTIRGWGILLALCAAGSLAFGFWLSLKHKKLESAKESKVSIT